MDNDKGRAGSLRIPLVRLLPHLVFLSSPWLLAFGLSFVITFLAMLYLVAISRSNVRPLFLAVAIAAIAVGGSPHAIPVDAVTASAALVSLHLSLILVSPWVSMTIELARNTWLLHLSYILFFLVFLVTEDLLPKASMQICLFTYLSYVTIYSRNWLPVLRDIWLLAITALGSARAIFIGYILGRIITMVHSRIAYLLIYLAAVSTIVILVVLKDELVSLMTVGYEGLKSSGYLLKGRTAYALALLDNTKSIDFLGNGAGYSMRTMLSAFTDRNQLHNDFLRMLVDYGMLPLIAVIVIVSRRMLENISSAVVLTMFLVFTLTGNVLSYAAVIFPLLVALCKDRRVREAGAVLGRASPR